MKAILRINHKVFYNNIWIVIPSIITIFIYMFNIYVQNNIFNIHMVFGNDKNTFYQILLNFIINFTYVYYYFLIYKFHVSLNKDSIILRMNENNFTRSIIITYIMIIIIISSMLLFSTAIFSFVLFKKIVFLSLMECLQFIFSKIIIALIVLIMIRLFKHDILIVSVLYIIDFFFFDYSIITYNIVNSNTLLLQAFTIIVLIILIRRIRDRNIYL